MVAKIAALSTQEIPGVQAMGKTVTRAFGAIRSKVPGASPATAQGVSVEVGERQAAIDIDIVCYYGQSIVETADAIRQNVIERIEGMTGLEVVEVNVSVDDLYIESDGDDQGFSGRVTDTVPPPADRPRPASRSIRAGGGVWRWRSPPRSTRVVGVRRTGGPGVEVATQYPGGRVVGVRLGPDEVTVHIIAERLPLDTVADAVHAAVGAALAGLGDRRAVAVTIDDLDVSSMPGGRLR